METECIDGEGKCIDKTILEKLCGGICVKDYFD